MTGRLAQEADALAMLHPARNRPHPIPTMWFAPRIRRLLDPTEGYGEASTSEGDQSRGPPGGGVTAHPSGRANSIDPRSPRGGGTAPSRGAFPLIASSSRDPSPVGQCRSLRERPDGVRTRIPRSATKSPRRGAGIGLRFVATDRDVRRWVERFVRPDMLGRSSPGLRPQQDTFQLVQPAAWRSRARSSQFRRRPWRSP